MGAQQANTANALLNGRLRINGWMSREHANEAALERNTQIMGLAMRK